MIFTNTDVSFTKAELVALLAHASKDETRPHLSAVYFDADHGKAVAADRCRLAICEGDGKGQWTYLAARSALDTAVRTKGAAVFVLNVACGTIAAMDKDSRKLATVDVSRATGTFPPYMQVVGAAAKSHSRQALNAGYLADIKTVADATGETTIRFYPGENERDPMQFHVGRWTVLLMPFRTDALAATDRDNDKALISAREARPRTAIVLATAPSVPEVTPAVAQAINAPSLGSDAPASLPAAPVRSKSRDRLWRETHATVCKDSEQLRAWIEDAAEIDPAPRDVPPWG